MSNRNRQSEEKLHYDSLIKFLTTTLGITGGAITVIVGIALYWTYNNVSDLKKEYKDAVADFTKQTTDLKNDEKETIKSIKEDANQTVAITKADSKEAISTAKLDLRDQINSTNEATQNEIARIRAETNRLALIETQSQVEKIFKSDKIQDIIENQAVKEIKEKVTSLVYNSTKNLTKINDAASQMRRGFTPGLPKLRSYFIHPNNSNDSLLAKDLYDQICADYHSVALKSQKSFIEYLNVEFNNPNPKYSGFKIIQNKYPSDLKDQKFLTYLVDIIKNEKQEYGLDDVSFSIVLLSTISGQPFKPFEIDEISKWYNGLIRNK